MLGQNQDQDQIVIHDVHTHWFGVLVVGSDTVGRNLQTPNAMKRQSSDIFSYIED